MHTRGRSRIRAGETEKEIDEQEQEIELITDSEMEQQTDEIAEPEIITDKEKKIIEEAAQGDQPDKPNQKEDLSMQEMFKLLLENSKRLEEKYDKTNEENKENFRKTNEEIKETSKQIHERLDRNDEGLKQMKEDILQIHEEN